MSYDAKMKNLSWLTVVLLAVAGSGFAFIPTANEELTALEDRPVSLETLDNEVLPLRGGGEGHGSYCTIAGLGVYFYGRDLGDKIGSYEDFEAWCESRGATVAWSE